MSHQQFIALLATEDHKEVEARVKKPLPRGALKRAKLKHLVCACRSSCVECFLSAVPTWMPARFPIRRPSKFARTN